MNSDYSICTTFESTNYEARGIDGKHRQRAPTPRIRHALQRMLTSNFILFTKPARPSGRFADFSLLGIASVVVAAAFTCSFPATAADGVTNTPSASLRVTVVPVTRRCFPDTVETAGRLVPRQEILIRPEIEGLRVSQVLVEDGDRVTEGQVLARLNRPDGQSSALPPAATIKSPAGGVISYRSAQLHAPATARGDPLFRLIVDGEVELRAEVPALKLGKLAPGLSASVEIPGRDDLIVGRVREVPSVIDQRTQTADVRVFLGDQKLPIGIFAKAIIIVGESCGANVPLSAVIYDDEGTVVQVVRNNQVETRRVRVGLLSEGNVEIRDGLKEGELVVARSGAFLREGDAVRPVVVQPSPTAQAH
jgi:HlyD family secretion protein